MNLGFTIMLPRPSLREPLTLTAKNVPVPVMVSAESDGRQPKINGMPIYLIPSGHTVIFFSDGMNYHSMLHTRWSRFRLWLKRWVLLFRY